MQKVRKEVGIKLKEQMIIYDKMLTNSRAETDEWKTKFLLVDDKLRAYKA